RHGDGVLVERSFRQPQHAAGAAVGELEGRRQTALEGFEAEADPFAACRRAGPWVAARCQRRQPVTPVLHRSLLFGLPSPPAASAEAAEPVYRRTASNSRRPTRTLLAAFQDHAGAGVGEVVDGGTERDTAALGELAVDMGRAEEVKTHAGSDGVRGH